MPISEALWRCLLPVALFSAACTVNVPDDDGAAGGGQASSAGGGSGGAAAGAGGVATGGGGSPSPVAGASVGGTAGAPSGGAGASTGGAGASSGGSATAGSGGAQGGAGGALPASPSDLPAPPGGANVPKPSGAVGGLTVLDWAGFKAAVSYTFDDSNSSQISHYDELAALGVRFTFYLQTGKTESMNAVWAKAAKAGHELGNHTKSHSSNATGEDIDAATQFIEKLGVKVWTMAAPNGAPGYTDLAKPRFLINRGVANGLVGPNDSSDPFTLYCFIPEQGALQSAFDSQVTSARTAGKWRIILVHGFTGGTDGAYKPVAFNEFSNSVKAAKAMTDLWLDSVVNVGAYWRGQKAFSQVTPTTSGSQQTWTWKLPEHFPPGKYLRVKVTGGTVSQKGTPLAWDPHGYYEVALDAGSVTLGP